jgi:all-trans-retinol 13,14-reductase
MKTDAVVIGSGFGGLSAAILLARLGRSVTLIESAAQPGGCLRSYTREGVDCPVGVHYFGAAAPGELLGDFIDTLGVRQALKLRRLGQQGVIDRFVFDDEVFDIPDTVEKLETALRKRFASTPEAVDFVVGVFRASMASLRTDRNAAAPHSLPFARNAIDVFTEMRLPERLMDILAMHGTLLGLTLSKCPAAFLMFSTASLLMSAWELGCSGSDMANALAGSAVDVGVELIVGDAVAGIEVGGRGVTGVRLSSGQRVETDVVIAAIHPKLMLDLIPGPALPQDYRSGIGRLRETVGMFGVVALVDERLHPAQDFNLFRAHGAPSRKLEGGYRQIRACSHPGKTRLLALTESPYQDWARWHDTKTGRRGPEYRLEKMRRAESLLADMATGDAGILHDPEVIDIWTPLTMRDWLTAPEGSPYGVQHSICDGLDYLVLSRSPIERLLLAGQSALAPGLVGVSMGVMRVVSAVVGRQAVHELMAKSRLAAREAST